MDRSNPVSPLLDEESEFPDLPRGTKAGPYELIRRLGSGGMGVVYLARDLRLGRLAALKFLKSRNKQDTQRFVAEARATAHCKHDNIVTVFDVGRHEGFPYIALEYVRGQTLRNWLDEHAPAAETPDGRLIRPPVSTDRALSFLIPVVRALVYAHGMGIVHRDIKPENIMISETNTIKVLDFGIARPMTSTDDPEMASLKGDTQDIVVKSFQPETKALLGTRPYMAPEQVLGLGIDGQSDLWAVGIILCELVTGQNPMNQDVVEHADFQSPLPRVHDLNPDLDSDRLATVIDRCLLKPKAHRMPNAKALLKDLEAHAEPDHISNRSALEPFAGLAAFQETDAERFFGRTTDIGRIVARLRTEPFLGVSGPSGAGKSSLVRAGVIPTLKGSGEGWEARIIRPGRYPLAALARLVDSLQSSSRRSTLPVSVSGAHEDRVGRLRREPGALGATLRAWTNEAQRRLLVFVDQLEELYTLGAPVEDRSAFARCLEAIADDATSPLRIIVAFRSDLIERITEDRRLSVAVSRGLVLIPRMHRQGLEDALTQPLRQYDYRFESQALVAAIVSDLENVSAALPLLQFTAAQLWARRDRQKRILTEASYQELGGVTGTLATHANTILSAMSKSDQSRARAIFLRLVTPERTRALTTIEELRTLTGTASARADSMPGTDTERVLNRLIEARLLTVERGAQDESMVELIHESLITHWPQLSEWLSESRETTARLTRIQQAAKQWDQEGRAEGLLWRDQAAKDAIQLYESHPEALPFSTSDIAFMDALVDLTKRTQRKQQSVFFAILALLSAFIVTLIFSAIRADRAKALAETEAVIAKNATLMAAAEMQRGDPTVALALIRELDPRHLPPRWSELASWAVQRGVTHTIIANPSIVYSAAFAPDPSRIVTASHDGLVRVLHLKGEHPSVILQGHDRHVWMAEFSPDGRRVVSASGDKTARIWNLDAKDPSAKPIVLRGHESEVSTAFFSPDGRRVVTASEDTTVRIWSADGTGEPVILHGHRALVESARFSPDGTRVVSASKDGTARIWTLDGKTKPVILSKHDAGVKMAAFGPNGQRVVTASRDGKVRLFRVTGGDPIRIWEDHEDTVRWAELSPDGLRILTASSDRTARIFSIDDTEPPIVLRGHREWVYTARFSTDGTQVVTGGLDWSTRVWKLSDIVRPRHLVNGGRGSVQAIKTKDDRTLITADEDHKVRIWDLETFELEKTLPGHTAHVTSLQLDESESKLLTASADMTLRIWDLNATPPSIVFRGHTGPINHASFEGNDQMILSTALDNTVRLWFRDDQRSIVFRCDPPCFKGNLSQDRTKVVAIAGDRTARIWSLDRPEEPVVVQLPSQPHKVFFVENDTMIHAYCWDDSVWSIPMNGDTSPTRVLIDDPERIDAIKSADERRILLRNRTLALGYEDGTGAPFLLFPATSNTTNAFHYKLLLKDGRQIIAATEERKLFLWKNLHPWTGIDDPRLWRATTFCPPVKMRMDALGVTRQQAQTALTACRQNVALAAQARPQ